MDIKSIKIGGTFKKIATALLLTVFVVGCSSTTNKGYLKTQEVAFSELKNNYTARRCSDYYCCV